MNILYNDSLNLLNNFNYCGNNNKLIIEFPKDNKAILFISPFDSDELQKKLL